MPSSRREGVSEQAGSGVFSSGGARRQCRHGSDNGRGVGEHGMPVHVREGPCFLNCTAQFVTSLSSSRDEVLVMGCVDPGYSTGCGFVTMDSERAYKSLIVTAD